VEKIVLKSLFGHDYKFLINDNYRATYEPIRDNEISLLKICKELGKVFNIFVDVGACTGKYCIILSKFYKKVYAIEPNPFNLKYLYENIKLNNINNVHIFEYAVLDTETEMFLTLEGAQSKLISQTGDNVVKVKVTRLDKLIERADIIKIDTEGNEFKVVTGALELILRCRPIFLIEHNEFWFNEPLKDFKEILSYMIKINYMPFNVNYVHWIYIPKEKMNLIPKEVLNTIVGNHFFYEIILENIKQGRAWYYGLPETWWHGISILEFIENVGKHILEEKGEVIDFREEWKNLYLNTFRKYI